MKKSTILLIVALVAIVGIASAGYNSLKAKENTPQVAQANGTDDQAAAAKESSEENVTGAQQERPKIAAPNFVVFDEEENQIYFEDLVGKPAVINFWASWCSYCKVEMPDFQRVYDNYKDKDITFMMIAGTDGQRETRETAKALFDEEGFTMPIYYDEALMGKDDLDVMASANAAYRISGYPSTVFVDSDGFVAGIYTGALDEARLTKLVDFLMDENNNGKSLEDAFK